MTGTTGMPKGRPLEVPHDGLALDRVKSASTVPVCAGFGIRSREQVARFASHVDGVVVAPRCSRPWSVAATSGPFSDRDGRTHYTRLKFLEASLPSRIAVAGCPCTQRTHHCRNSIRVAQSVRGRAMGDLPMLERGRSSMWMTRRRAIALSALARAAAAPTGAPWICEGCGEHLEPQFTQCWRCGLRTCLSARAERSRVVKGGQYGQLVVVRLVRARAGRSRVVKRRSVFGNPSASAVPAPTTPPATAYLVSWSTQIGHWFSMACLHV